MTTTVDLHGRHLLSLKDFSREELVYLLDLAAELKAASTAAVSSARGPVNAMVPPK